MKLAGLLLNTAIIPTPTRVEVRVRWGGVGEGLKKSRNSATKD